MGYVIVTLMSFDEQSNGCRIEIKSLEPPHQTRLLGGLDCLYIGYADTVQIQMMIILRTTGCPSSVDVHCRREQLIDVSSLLPYF